LVPHGPKKDLFHVAKQSDDSKLLHNTQVLFILAWNERIQLRLYQCCIFEIIWEQESSSASFSIIRGNAFGPLQQIQVTQVVKYGSMHCDPYPKCATTILSYIRIHLHSWSNFEQSNSCDSSLRFNRVFFFFFSCICSLFLGILLLWVKTTIEDLASYLVFFKWRDMSTRI
jgi:hypothetical protein